MLSNQGTPFNEDGWAAMIADIRRLFLLVGGGSNDLNQASTDVTQDATVGGENANNAFKIRNVNISTTAPTDQQVVAYSADRKQWEPTGGTAGAAFSFLVSTNNLSDVASASTARTNLGLGTAATQATGTFLQGANNLSDVGSYATVKNNLTLGAGSAVSFSSLALGAGLTVASGTVLSGGLRVPTAISAVNYAAGATDVYIVMSGSVCTLPTVTGNTGRVIMVSGEGAGTTVSAFQAGETIRTLTGVTVGAGRLHVFVADGVSNWNNCASS